MKSGDPGPKDLVNHSQLDLPMKHRVSTINPEAALNEKNSDYKLSVSNTASEKIQCDEDHLSHQFSTECHNLNQEGKSLKQPWLPVP